MLKILIDHRNNWVLQKLGNRLHAVFVETGVDCSLIESDVFIRHDKNEIFNPDDDLLILNYNLYRSSYKNRFRSVGVFLTHAETDMKVKEFRKIHKSTDYVVCMSNDDARSCLGLCSDSDLPDNVFAEPLPAIRPNTTKRLPFILSIFSNCYPDGRKREHLILEWIRRYQPQDLLIRLIGNGWLEFSKELEKLDVSFQLSSLNSSIFHEYLLQQSFFLGSDVCLYTGNDGGALCVYDALELKVRPLMLDMGYSGELLDSKDKFKDDNFFQKLNSAYKTYDRYSTKLENSNIEVYANHLLKFINSERTLSDKDKINIRFREISPQIRNFNDLKSALRAFRASWR